MSSSNGNPPSGSTAAQQPQANFVFFVPPPPTVWVQFSDGMQMSFTPTPERYLQSMLSGVPLFGSMSETGGANADSSDGFMNMLNELFQRAQAQQHGPPPTSKSFLDKLPIKIWSQDTQKTEVHNECVICLSDYENDDKVISLPCGHTFHKDCGMTWLVEHNVCPTCRYQLPTQKDCIVNAATEATATPSTTEPEREPTSQTAANVTGVRRQRPTEVFRPRDVRQRVVETVTTSADEDAELDRMLEQEADRFVKEEMEKRQIMADDASIEIEDCDVEELLNELS
ncbi:E3 ubiquitin-protein ligase RING1-like [Phytophthora citrophthora]|uniref:E3 ubiquitin-protein ligase RING1-like n=1 Tax=Phytophthora citrophthora TaxID=4793 RepID=A0AAD9LRS7_9STRA|nr:E3 ubiquitin-protein ligase RING1-like [Phytophthora citrophthora]